MLVFLVILTVAMWYCYCKTGIKFFFLNLILRFFQDLFLNDEAIY